MFENIWEEKYRPKTLDDFIINTDNKNLLLKYKEQGEIKHLILFGPAGIGKTTLAKVIVNNLIDCQYDYINASSEKGIDVIRDRIVSFARTASIAGKIKIIILDEADGLTSQAQEALRGVMDEYIGVCRFILTGNFRNKIIEPLLSRCEPMDLTVSVNDVMKHLFTILVKKEKIKIANPEAFKNVVSFYYPDIRKCLQVFQRYTDNGELKLPTIVKNGLFVKELYDNIVDFGDIMQIRKYMFDNVEAFRNDYNWLLKLMFNQIFEEKLDENKKRDCLVCISKHLYQAETVMDKEINAFACFVELKIILSK